MNNIQVAFSYTNPLFMLFYVMLGALLCSLRINCPILLQFGKCTKISVFANYITPTLLEGLSNVKIYCRVLHMKPTFIRIKESIFEGPESLKVWPW